MNQRIIKLGLESGMLNYVEHETPRHYFLCGHADEECLEKFAELIVQECIEQFAFSVTDNTEIIQDRFTQCRKVAKHFGVEE